jgi:glycosyltransferase involved in cell wall biosynthesis
MPVYNGAAFLAEAVESILGQSAGDFELLVVDDGSTDRTVEILRGYADPRLQLVQSSTNQGIVTSLNRGLDRVGEGCRYVVRMDADDVSLPDRLEKQVRFMDDHPDVGVCGGGVEGLTESGHAAPGGSAGDVRRPPSAHEDIVCGQIFGPGFAHPTVILRAELIRRGLRYDVGFRYAQDYELWTRCAQVTRLAAISDVVLRYRAHLTSISHRHHQAQEGCAARVRERQLRALGVEPTAVEGALHASLALGWYQPERWYLDAVRRWLERLAAANRQSRCLPRDRFERMLGKRLLDVARFAADHGVWSGRRVLGSPLIRGLGLAPVERLRMGVRGARAELRALYRQFS